MPLEEDAHRKETEALIILIEIRSLLDNHIKRFDEHVALDDKREDEAKDDRKSVAEELVKSHIRQERVFMYYGLAIIVIQVILKMWK